jgi:PKD repeat protein
MKKYTAFNKINLFSAISFSLLFCMAGYELKAQLSYKVLFLGNSYTYVNDLPQIVHDVALSAGDTLYFDSYAPGGYRLIDHSTDITTQNKIMNGGWDYVVIQGQSQEPVINTSQFINGGLDLRFMVKQYNPCAVMMPYITWGRKNGDSTNCVAFPVMCTYESMDSALKQQYLNLTSFINGEVSPVSVVWNYLRQNYPGIELYQADESHPSAAGSYAAACCFYAALFKKDPGLITFNFGLDTADASVIRNASKTLVFDSLLLWDLKKEPIADLSYEAGQGTNEIIFHSINHGVQQNCFWDFGDGDTSSSAIAAHTYSSDGDYTVTLTVTTCDLQGLHSDIADTVIQFCSHTPTIYTTQSWLCHYDTIWTQPAGSYQWFAYGIALPETNRYLPVHAYPGTSGFAVISTDSGCAELSESYNETPILSGYYFDAMGDPCAGDTVVFAVLHINGFLSGQENILWFKNDSLLPFMTNEDTLLITVSGKYECQVIDPGSDCPLDTTSFTVDYNCGISGVEEPVQELTWTFFPNPSSEIISINFKKTPVHETVQIYNAIGDLIRSIVSSSSSMEFNIADLPAGFYFIRLKNCKQPPQKFIKL